MVSWNYADVFEAVADRVPDRPALIHGNRVTTWGQFERRANALAADLLASGLGHQSRVGIYTTNCSEYLETQSAAMKVAMVPFNVNFRYGPDEVGYLLNDAPAEAVVVAARFLDVLAATRDRLPGLRRVYVLADEAADGTRGVLDPGSLPDWATPYESVVGPGADRAATSWGRTGDDIVQLYTGGTTGMPKGVLWRQHDLFVVSGCVGQPAIDIPIAETVEAMADRAERPGNPYVLITGSPLMHGTGQFTSMLALTTGGAVITLTGASFDPAELLDAIDRNRATTLVIAGQAFAMPLLAELEAHPGQRDLSSLVLVISSGVMWSQVNKEGLLRHMPGVILYDSLGSSEAIGLGASVTTSETSATTADFVLGPDVAVFTEDGRRVEPGSGEAGLLATSGNIPLGYHGDEAKTAATFPTIEGRRWSMPGDWAEVRADGSLHLLGRGSVCINTGGEKVFPEEVEEALKLHPAVADAVVVGLPDDRFGEIIVAVVETAGPTTADGVTDVTDARSGAGGLPTDELDRLVREHLAPFKVPRRWVLVDTIGRAPNGKVDYRGLRALATERLAGTGSATATSK
jgi:fatty-acyl-CoA synthase